MGLTSSSEKPARNKRGTWQLWFLTVKTLLIFVLIDVGLNWKGFDRVYSHVVRGKTARPHLLEDKAREYVEMAVRAVQHAMALYHRKRLDCLPRSLALFLLLKKLLPVELCIGVKKFPFSGHAWVEYEGCVVGDHSARVSFYTVILR